MHQIQSALLVNCQSSSRWRNILAAWIRHDFMWAYSLCFLIAASFGFLNPGLLPTTNDGCSTAAPVRLYSCSPHPHGRHICNDFLFCLTWIRSSLSQVHSHFPRDIPLPLPCFVRLLIHSFIHLFTHSFVHSFIP